jgi:hypothetical protein
VRTSLRGYGLRSEAARYPITEPKAANGKKRTISGTAITSSIFLSRRCLSTKMHGTWRYPAALHTNLSMRRMTDRVKRADIDELIAEFTRVPNCSFLVGAAGAIVFQCGTLVRLDCESHTPLAGGFMGVDLSDDFPEHRLPHDSYESNRDENELDFQWSQRGTAFPAECRKAYGCLMRSGYPLPGTPGADRVVYRDGGVFATILHALGPCCMTLAHSGAFEDGFVELTESQQIQAVDAVSAEHRRLDYMYPKPYAYLRVEGEAVSVVKL